MTVPVGVRATLPAAAVTSHGRATTSSRRSVALTLALAEAWRIVRHPVALVGFALGVLMLAVVGTNSPVDAFEAPTTGPTYFFGVFAYFAANLVTTRDRRADADELLAPVATDRLTRTLANILAALGPALVTAGVVVVTVGAYDALGFFEVRPDFWHLAQGPVSVLGGALLGIMVGRWAPYPGVALLVMVAMVAWNVVTANSESWGAVGTYASWARYTDDGSWGGLYPGSPFWHVVYLGSLCGMAAAGALLRDVASRLPLLAVGALLTVSAVLSGWAALP